MDDNPYKSPATLGARPSSTLSIVLSRIVWVGLGLLGVGTAALGIVILVAGARYLVAGPSRDTGLVLGLGTATSWMGTFLVFRAIRRFRRRAPKSQLDDAPLARSL